MMLIINKSTCSNKLILMNVKTFVRYDEKNNPDITSYSHHWSMAHWLQRL